MRFLHSRHVKIMLTCIVAFIGVIVAMNVFHFYSSATTTIGVLVLIVFPITLILAGRRFARFPFNNFTTWIGFIMIGICILHWISQDDKGLGMTLFTLDFVFMWLLYHYKFGEYLMVNGNFVFFGYFTRVVLGCFYGILLDVFVYIMKKIKILI